VIERLGMARMSDAVVLRPARRPGQVQDRPSGSSHPTLARPWGSTWVLLVPAVVVAYVLSHFRYPEILSGGFNIYLAQPLTWLGVGLLGYMGWRFGLPDRPAVRLEMVGLAILLGLFDVSLSIFAGFLSRFGLSPYGHRLDVLLGNLLYVGTTLAGVEMARAYLMALVGRKRPLLGLILVSLLFALAAVPPARVGVFESAISAVRFGGESLLPLLAESLLASLLAQLGGPIAAIAFRAVPAIFEWGMPVLPNPPWALSALFGTMAPAIGMLVVQAQQASNVPERRLASNPRPSAWLLATFAGVALIWFNQGVFGVRPTVVSGVSMRPALRAGDLVLTTDVAPEKIAVGDIVRFRVGGSYVLHRVVEIRQAAGLEFITRGDANNVDDPPLPASAVEGRVVTVLPGLGWPSIVVRLVLQWLLGLFAR